MDIKKIKALVNQAKVTEDHSKAAADFVRDIPEAGLTIGRLIEYIDLGMQARKPYQGAERKPALQVRLVFELLGKKKNNIKEIEVDGVKKKVAQRISISLTKSMNKKAKFFKLFEKMAYGRQEITHMADMLGEAFLITITHGLGEDGKPKYANMTTATGDYQIAAPFKEDPMSGERTVFPCPEALSDYKLFIWDFANKECWDSLFIDGEREEDDGKGNKKVVSKNWIQGTIMKATNFVGSPIAQLLEGAEEIGEFATDDLEMLDDELPDSMTESTPAPVLQPSTKVKTKAGTSIAKTAKATVAKTADVFAGLGVPDDESEEI